MDEKELTELVQALLHELNRPERYLATVVRDFEECGIDYAIIGSLAVRCHNYLRAGNDIDVLVSKEGFPEIAQLFIGRGYSYRPVQPSTFTASSWAAKYPWTSMLRVKGEKAVPLCRIREHQG
jgi:hypothetical protein